MELTLLCSTFNQTTRRRLPIIFALLLFAVTHAAVHVMVYFCSPLELMPRMRIYKGDRPDRTCGGEDSQDSAWAG